jgi:radical SAM protein with 4Fe4S-binding SPASM domain
MGSKKYFFRLDFYPLFSPHHPDRHLAYFDLSLERIVDDCLCFSIQSDNLLLTNNAITSEVPAVWRGDLPLAGYCRITVSLWLINDDQPEQIEALSSPTMLLQNKGDQPLEWLQVAVTDKCNLRCPMCTRQHGLSHSNADIPVDVLDALLDAAPDVIYLGLQGLGEPLMHRDLPGVVKAFRKRMPTHGRIAVTTNGTLLSKSLAQDLIDAGINTFTFSIDGASKEIYEDLRGGANFDQVIANIRNTVDCVKRSDRKALWVSANFAMGPGNLSEVPAFTRLVSSLALNSVYFFHAREYPHMKLVPLDESLLTQVTNDSRQIARNEGLIVRFASSKITNPPKCPFMTNAYMWITGEVTPCQRMEPPGEPWPTRILGNVKGQSLKSIWNSVEAKEFRRDVLGGYLPAECQGCTFCDSVVC